MIVQDEKRKVNARWEEGRTKRRVLYVLYAVAVFLLTILIAGIVMNRENPSRTGQPGQSTYPVITLIVAGSEVNPLCAYTAEVKMKTMRATILPVAHDRTVRFVAEADITSLQNLRFEVRSADGASLVENTPIDNLRMDEAGYATGSFVLKDLIDYDTEYMLVILGETEGMTLRYYSRMICASSDEAYHVADKLDFVRSFHYNALSKERAQEIATYIESNAEGDNSSFAHVDIHSSFQQITFGDLDILSHTAPVIRISDMQTQTGEFLLDYELTFQDEDGRARECRVQEVYQVRYAPERIYLLEYERQMHYIFRGEKADVTSGTLKLSINDKALEMAESGGGNTLVFRIDDRLYAYNLTENKMSLLYSVDETTRRASAMCQELKILQVDEASNVKFMVSGYLNRGQHEGRIGVVVYQFNAAVNTIEELVCIYTDVAPEILNAGTRRLSYVNQDEVLYLMPEHTVYAVDLREQTYRVAIEDIAQDSYHISSSGSKMIWQGAKDTDNDRMYLIDFNRDEITTIEADAGEYIMPLGFMGEDYVYGLMRTGDVRLDAVGNPVNAMYGLQIRDTQGNLLEDYKKDGIFITDAYTEDNQLYLTRVQFDSATGGYTPTVADQIMNTLEAVQTGNRIVVRTDPVQKNLVEIALKTGADGSSMKLLTPGEVLREDMGVMGIEEAQKSDTASYYVYDKGAVENIYVSPADAIQKAYGCFGVVANSQGNVIWRRGNQQTRNQIMAITSMVESGQVSAATADDSLAACLDLMLTHAGVSRNVKLMLSEGSNAYDIVGTSLPDVEVLDLTGCRLQSTLYYLNRDLPVLAGLNNGSNVLIIGFNERNVVIAAPVAGTVTKMGMNDASSYMERNGNRFLTYLPASSR